MEEFKGENIEFIPNKKKIFSYINTKGKGLLCSYYAMKCVCFI